MEFFGVLFSIILTAIVILPIIMFVSTAAWYLLPILVFGIGATFIILKN